VQGRGTYFGTSVYAFEKIAMINGQENVPAKQFILAQAVYSVLIGDNLHMLAADVDGPSAPSSNVVPIFSSQDDDLGPNFPGKVDAINVWDLTIDWSNLDNTILEYAVQLEVPEFSSYIPPPGEDARDNIELPGGQKVSGLGRFLLRRLAYRDFGEYASMLTTRGVV
jgi:hypothetical protein